MGSTTKIMDMTLAVATFYRFVDLPDYRELREPIRTLAERHRLRGTFLLAEEGFNSTLSGEHTDLEAFFQELGQDRRFEGLEVKYSECAEHPFGRLRVRLKKEIVRMKAADADPRKGVGIYVPPEEWNSLISSPDVLTIDVRNDYEVEVGTFEGAVDPHTADFWEFPAWVEQNLTKKEQKLALFCTGGIRCERATAYLIARGFTQVHHLKGGILNYLDRVPSEESMWKGECFVFDDRWSVDHDLKATHSGSGREAEGAGSV